MIYEKTQRKRRWEYLKWNVANKIILIVNAKIFFNVNNMENFEGVTFFTTLIALSQNQVESTFPAFFNWRHLYTSWWFSWHMLFDTKSLPENFSWRRSSNLFRRFFLSTSIQLLYILHLNFTVTVSFFFKRWQAYKSPGLTSCLIQESALQMFSSSSS